MSVTPACFVDQAEKLCAESAEIDHRSAVSRAYYGLFHASKAWSAPLVPGSTGTGAGKAGSHEEVISRLRFPAPECKEDEKVISRAAGKLLHTMRIQRVVADYELEHVVSKYTATNACARAREAMKDLV